MKILKKIITSVMIIILLFSITKIFQNKSEAVQLPIQEVELYNKGEMVSFYYKATAVSVKFIVYQKDGVEYPAYCLDRNLMDIMSGQVMKATINKKIEDIDIWRVIVNGYPYKTVSELSCNSSHEAFAATKIAVYNVLYNYNWDDFGAYNEQGERVIKAARKISETAKESIEDAINGTIIIQSLNEEWKQDEIEEGYLSKNYEVCVNAESIEYTINLEKANIIGIKITDINNNENSVFQKGKQFKVLVPVSEIKQEDISFELHVKSKLKTIPILYGETPSVVFQDYAVTADVWEYQEGIFQDRYLIDNKADKEDTDEESVDKKGADEEHTNEESENGAHESNEVLTEKEEQGLSELDGKSTININQKTNLQKKEIKKRVLPRTGF